VQSCALCQDFSVPQPRDALVMMSKSYPLCGPAGLCSRFWQDSATFQGMSRRKSLGFGAHSGNDV
jgi:hypothetical protein